MRIYVPVSEHSIYSPIVLSSILIGIAVACFLMKKAGAKKATVIYTALLVFVCILTFSFTLSFMLYGQPDRVGFIGAFGAFGVLAGALLSAFIHKDVVRESVSAWIVTAPLMYGLSKIACHFSGCCYGIRYSGPFSVTYRGPESISAPLNTQLFPVQLSESICFILIFVIGVTLFLKNNDKLNAAIITLILCILFKCLFDVLREGGNGFLMSANKLSAMIIGSISVIIIIVIKIKTGEDHNGSK